MDDLGPLARGRRPTAPRAGRRAEREDWFGLAAGGRRAGSGKPAPRARRPKGAAARGDNFCKRLAEVFKNLDWIFENRREAFNIDEFRVYEDLYARLRHSHQSRVSVSLPKCTNSLENACLRHSDEW
jgi:hypothetical protein